MNKHLKRLLREMERPAPRLDKICAWLDSYWMDIRSKRQQTMPCTMANPVHKRAS